MRFESIVLVIYAAAVLAMIAPWPSLAGAGEPDANGDAHSNCHTGSKYLGDGGNDKGESCGAVPTVMPPLRAPSTKSREI